MTLQIEEGKFYRTNKDHKVGPMKVRRYGEFIHRHCDSCVWRVDGTLRVGTEVYAQDIVAEWVDEPAGFTPEQEAKLANAIGEHYARKAETVDLNQMLYGDDPNRVTKKTVLETALQTVADRGVPYGGVEDNFNRIARLWNAHLFNRFDVNGGGMVEIAALGAEDVAMMMALMKIARLEANPSHADSWVDVAGYAACGGEIGAKMAVDV